MGTMKYQQLQASSDDHNNNIQSQAHELDLLDLPPPDYNQSHELKLPPTYPRRAMASSSLPSIRIHLGSTFDSRKRVFFTLVTLCTILHAATFIFAINDVFALSKWDTRSVWQLTYLVGPLIQNVYNFQCFIEFRAYDDLRKHGDLLLENANQENANQENNNSISFWPLWIYSAPMLLIMMFEFYIDAPITMIIAIGVYVTINIVFILTVMLRPDQKNTSQDFDVGLPINIFLGTMAVVLLVMGIIEKSVPAASLSQSSSSSPLASATSVFLGAH